MSSTTSQQSHHFSYCKQSSISSKNFYKNIYKAAKKYMNLNSKYYATTYNDLILEALLSNGKCHTVAVFKDYLISDDLSEFLNRYYKTSESKIRIKKVVDYYHLTSVIFPNYTPIVESKYLYKNVIHKQKLIDELQMQEDYQNHLKKQKNKYASPKVFNTTAYDEIINESNSLLINMLGLQKNNNNLDESEDECNKILDIISIIKDNENKNTEQTGHKISLAVNSHIVKPQTNNYLKSSSHMNQNTHNNNANNSNNNSNNNLIVNNKLKIKLKLNVSKNNLKNFSKENNKNYNLTDRNINKISNNNSNVKKPLTNLNSLSNLLLSNKNLKSEKYLNEHNNEITNNNNKNARETAIIKSKMISMNVTSFSPPRHNRHQSLGQKKNFSIKTRNSVLSNFSNSNTSNNLNNSSKIKTVMQSNNNFKSIKKNIMPIIDDNNSSSKNLKSESSRTKPINFSCNKKNVNININVMGESEANKNKKMRNRNHIMCSSNMFTENNMMYKTITTENIISLLTHNHQLSSHNNNILRNNILNNDKNNNNNKKERKDLNKFLSRNNNNNNVNKFNRILGGKGTNAGFSKKKIFKSPPATERIIKTKQIIDSSSNVNHNLNNYNVNFNNTNSNKNRIFSDSKDRKKVISPIHNKKIFI